MTDSTIHPFIAAVQAAFDAHGLPENIHYMSIGRSPNTPFTVWADDNMRHKGSAATFGGALAAAVGSLEDGERRVAQIYHARKALEAAGLDPALVAA